MRNVPRPFLVLGFMFLMAALWIAQRPPSPTLGRALKDAEARMREFYAGHPLPAGWRLAGVSVVSRQGEVWVDMRLAGDAAATLKGKPRPVAATVVAGHCPPKSDPVWRILQPRQELEIRAVDDGSVVLVAVNCRAQGPE